ncbi:Transposase, putative [Shewanella piezotolerans WP3]|uniref:Transposase, putative n=1 Tax=Shewanella piezotolerans (strain WP3 / JCM 13877) TaxID=225849 RepID=B8CMQ8_SHEPW|nr:IS21 family transposase [Shewanella piezotolerans]ACJ29448.1 Transposase, putative [Shewanella piezotolerans WP3]
MLSKKTRCLIARLLQTTKLSLRAVARTANCSHVTVMKTKKVLEENSISWQSMETMDEVEINVLFFPNWPFRNVQKIKPNMDAVIEFISKPKQTKRNAYYQVYLPTCPEGAAYKLTQFYKFVREHEGLIKLSMKLMHNAGEVMYVDYAGTQIPYEPENVIDPLKASIFVSTLGVSSYIFIYATPRQTTKDWIEAQVAMFEFYGGVPEIVIPDNPKALVTSSNPEKVLNKNYETFGKWYSTNILPGRPRKPKDKAIAENAVGFVTNRILSNMLDMHFESIEAMNQLLLVECQKLNREKFQKLSTSRQALFDKIDKPMLKTLPDKPFELIESVYEMNVPTDYCVLVKEHYYSVPFSYANKPVTIHVKSKNVEIFYQGKLIATHKRSYSVGEMTRVFEHMPPNHQFFEDKDIEYYWQWAEVYGQYTKKVIAAQFDCAHKKSRLANDRCRKIIKLAESSNLSNEEFEKACEFATQYNQMSPTRLRDVISSKAYEIDLSDVNTLVQIPFSNKHLRGADYYNSH